MGIGFWVVGKRRIHDHRTVTGARAYHRVDVLFHLYHELAQDRTVMLACLLEGLSEIFFTGASEEAIPVRRCPEYDPTRSKAIRLARGTRIFHSNR